MSTATASTPTGTLAEAAQILIDTRLDTIERMLMGQVSRGDRTAIVREVEAQIHDLLARRDPDDTDRDAVIAALGQLDPPEAYLPDEQGVIARPTVGSGRTAVANAPRGMGMSSSAAQPRNSMAARVSGILGIVSLSFVALVVMSFVTAETASGTAATLLAYAFYCFEFVVVITSFLAINMATFARLQGGWAIVGLTTGLMSLISGTLGFGLLFLLA